VLYGASELGLSFLLIFAGMSVGSIKSVTEVLPATHTVQLIDTVVSLLPLVLGMVLLFTSVVGVAAGLELWRGRRTGAVLGFLQIIVSITAALLFLSPGVVLSYSAMFYSVIGLNLFLGIMILAGWKYLR